MIDKKALNNSLFMYSITSALDDLFDNHYETVSGFFVNYSNKTDVYCDKFEDREIVIIGFMVDSEGLVERADIGKFFLSKYLSFDEVYSFADRFAGHYVVFYSDRNKSIVFTDATGAMQVNYFNNMNDIYISSVDRIIANHFNLSESDKSRRILAKSKGLNVLPNNITRYDDVKILLPNHYLDVNNMKSVRVPLGKVEEDVDFIVETTFMLAKNITKEYLKYYSIKCPLTAGYDSRVIFGFLKNQYSDIECYTLFHDGFTEQTGDVSVPKMICDYYNIKEILLKDKIFSNNDHLESICGFDKSHLINMSMTISSSFPGEAIINGQIIDQVGKSCITGAIPRIMANRFMLSFINHNYGKDAFGEMLKYIKDVKSFGQFEDIMNVFPVEIRLGRWYSDYLIICSLCGLPCLNIFNCRKLIGLWSSIRRKMRVNKVIHKDFVKKLDVNLDSFPYNPGEKKKASVIFKKIWGNI